MKKINLLYLAIFALIIVNVSKIQAAAHKISKDPFDYGTARLFCAVKYDDVDNVKFILESYFDINARNSNGLTLLMVAVQNNSTKVIRHLLNDPRLNNIDATDKNGDTALIMAAKLRNTEFIDLLLKNNASILLKNKQGNDYKTELEIAIKKENVKLKKKFFQKPLKEALKKHDFNAAKKIISIGAIINKKIVKYFDTDPHVITFIEEYFKIKQKYIFLTDQEKNNQFLESIKKGLIKTAQELLIAGANMYCQDENGFNALMLAIISKRIDILFFVLGILDEVGRINNQFLIDHLKTINSDRDTALFLLGKYYSPCIEQIFVDFCKKHKIFDDNVHMNYSYFKLKSKLREYLKRTYLENYYVKLNEYLEEDKKNLKNYNDIESYRPLTPDEIENQNCLKSGINILSEFAKEFIEKKEPKEEIKSANWDTLIQDVYDSIAYFDLARIKRTIENIQNIKCEFHGFNVIDWTISCIDEMNISINPDNIFTKIDNEMLKKGLQILEFLLKQKINRNINLTDSLRYAVKQNQFECVKLLLKYGAYPWGIKVEDNNPLFMILENVEKLTEEDLDWIKFAIENSDINYKVDFTHEFEGRRYFYRLNAFIVALFKWSKHINKRFLIEKIIELLLINGANINLKIWWGRNWIEEYPELKEFILKTYYGYMEKIMGCVQSVKALELEKEMGSKNPPPYVIINSCLFDSDARIGLGDYKFREKIKQTELNETKKQKIGKIEPNSQESKEEKKELKKEEEEEYNADQVDMDSEPDDEPFEAYPDNISNEVNGYMDEGETYF